MRDDSQLNNLIKISEDMDEEEDALEEWGTRLLVDGENISLGDVVKERRKWGKGKDWDDIISLWEDQYLPKKKIRYETAVRLLNDFVFQATHNETIYVYKNGIFIPKGDILIKENLQRRLSGLFSSLDVAEILNIVRRSTYTDDLGEGNEKLICVRNGVLDLEKMELLPHSPKYMMVSQIPVEYNPKAECPKIKKFFSEVLYEDDKGVIEELIGYCLFRKYTIQKAFMFVGEGNNGKSVLIGLIRKFLGKENISGESLQAIAGNRFTSSRMFGKLANVYADLSDKSLSQTGIFKMLTGGDMISAEMKFKDSFNFINYAKLIFSANKVPEAFDDTTAFFRRWQFVKFPNVFDGENCDKNLLEKLSIDEELSGLLNIALFGLKRLLENGGFSSSKSTEETREEYIRLSSPVGSFVMDMLEFDSEGYVEKDELYQIFINYCNQMKLPTIDKTVFGRRLPQYINTKTERVSERGKRIYAWKGIKVKNNPKMLLQKNNKCLSCLSCLPFSLSKSMNRKDNIKYSISIGFLDNLTKEMLINDFIKKIMEDNNISENEAEKILEKLIHDGLIHEPRPGYLRRV